MLPCFVTPAHLVSDQWKDTSLCHLELTRRRELMIIMSRSRNRSRFFYQRILIQLDRLERASGSESFEVGCLMKVVVAISDDFECTRGRWLSGAKKPHELSSVSPEAF